MQRCLETYAPTTKKPLFWVTNIWMCTYEYATKNNMFVFSCSWNYLGGWMASIFFFNDTRKTSGCVLQCVVSPLSPQVHLSQLPVPRRSKDQTLPIGSRKSFAWIILKTILLFGLGLSGCTAHIYYIYIYIFLDQYPSTASSGDPISPKVGQFWKAQQLEPLLMWKTAPCHRSRGLTA